MPNSPVAHPDNAPPASRPLELLAPAGDRACLEAALEAGADAVYLGLTALNARRNARNFSEAELEAACELAHAMGRRIHLTLNIDLAQDELARAARMLEVASRARVDAVLVRDPALLALKPHFPELEYHLSTQACVACSADVEAARELGAARAVLARELSLAEIEAASRIPGIETEVFAQGALCFAVSGRCLLSSWVGGRSGNRGQCTSPCRVPWSLDGVPGGAPFSMLDLSLATRVRELEAAGVRSLKIEGRMKNPSWVRLAVSLLRKAIDRAAPLDELAREAERRAQAPGRKVTSGYFDGRRDAVLEPLATPAREDESGSIAAKPAQPTLRPSVASLLAEADTAARPSAGVAPDRARLSLAQAREHLSRLAPPGGAIVEDLDAEALQALLRAHPGARVVAALPQVFFEADRSRVEELVAAAAAAGVPVEVNGWGSWLLARSAGARLFAGPGLGVLNALAARKLAGLGFQEVTASVEADALKLDALISRSPVPCTAVVFGRPALLLTRAELSSRVASAELEDRRAVRLRARRSGELWELRPVQPFDLRAARLPPGVAHAVVDLIGSPDPVAEWEAPVPHATRFNFDRLLS